MSAAAGEKPEEVHPEKSQNKETETQGSDAVKQEVKASNDGNNTNQAAVKSEKTDPPAPKSDGQGDAVKEQDKAADGKPQEPAQNAAEKAKEEPTEEDLKTMPVRQYLETTGVCLFEVGVFQDIVVGLQFGCFVL
jgi:hypothetical protein